MNEEQITLDENAVYEFHDAIISVTRKFANDGATLIELIKKAIQTIKEA